MFTAIFGSVEAGAIYALMALGVYLSFRVLDFPDLTVDGSFVTGAAVAASMIVAGSDPFLATIVAMICGFAAGCLTGLLHTKGKINPLLSGILMMIALYSINLRIMGKSNVPLLSQETVITKLSGFWESLPFDSGVASLLTGMGLGGMVPKTWGILMVMLAVSIVIKLLLDAFLKTDLGLAIRAVGDNETMVRSFSADTDTLKILGLGLSNGLVAFSGALIAQYNGFSDVGMGIGMIIIGLASVIIGEAVFGAKTIFRATLAVIGGAILYRIIVTLALRADFLETCDMKLITAAIVVCALIIPRMVERQRDSRRRKKRRFGEKEIKKMAEEGGGQVAAAKTDL